MELRYLTAPSQETKMKGITRLSITPAVPGLLPLPIKASIITTRLAGNLSRGGGSVHRGELHTG